MSDRPAVLVIAGSDSSGGAGIIRDARVLADFGVDALCAVTAVTAQTAYHVVSVHPVPQETVRAQIHAALESRPIAAIKIGMLGTRETVNAVADCLPRHHGNIPIVIDPVLISSSGGVLLDDGGREALRVRLFPVTTVLTPNIPEAASLCGGPAAATSDARLAQARTLLTTGVHAVLLKGGHAEGAEASDLLLTQTDEPEWLCAPRVDASCRGTGCALASAIAAELAKGSSVKEACRSAKQYVLSFLSHS